MSQSFDRVAANYDRMRGGDDRGRQSAAEVAPYLVPGLVLEVGVGTGIVAGALRELGHPTFGVDIAEQMLIQARGRLGPTLARADAMALPIANESVSGVVFVHVLHLVSDMALALAEAARVLREGGRIIIIHGSPAADPDELVAALERLATLQPARPDTADGVRVAAERLELSVLNQNTTAGYSVGATPAQLIESITSKLPPYLWHVPDETWREVVEPVLADLRALAEPDRPRPQVWRSLRTVLAPADQPRLSG